MCAVPLQGHAKTDLLNPINTVQKVHAILLTGGSAFGLDAASGVVQFLEEKKDRLRHRSGPRSDRPRRRFVRPGIGGCRKSVLTRPPATPPAATPRPASIQEGNVGAGAGATVGKMLGPGRAMKAGIGTCSIRVGELKVAALVAVNAVGDIIDPRTCRIIAGARTPDGKGLADTMEVPETETCPPGHQARGPARLSESSRQTPHSTRLE